MVEVTNTGEGRALAVEGNGINVISDERAHGSARRPVLAVEIVTSADLL